MGKRNVNSSLAAALFVVVSVLGYGLISEAGNLEPSAPPAPTMKTLEQIEPATPITQLPYTISDSGVYYFTKNMYAGGGGITINVNNVIIDMKGYSMTGFGTQFTEHYGRHYIYHGRHVEK